MREYFHPNTGVETLVFAMPSALLSFPRVARKSNCTELKGVHNEHDVHYEACNH